MLKILADENIPFAKELFSELGDVSLKAGRTMNADDLIGVDALLVRSVTKVNQNLIGATDLKFVGTCTIGTDHLDKTYLESRGIAYSAAPGCNALGVVQYVLCALAALDRLRSPAKVAIIGCGNVGSRVWQALKNLGMDCYCIDPHLSKDNVEDLAPFEAIYDCDIICMHTPRIRDGAYPTENLLGSEQLKQLKAGALLINAGRGECIDNRALLSYLQQHSDLDVVLDVWADEPNMLPELFSLVKFGSPHIAGYSFEGKVNGTTMIFAKLAAELGKSEAWISQRIDALRKEKFGSGPALQADDLQRLLVQTYDINRDHQALAQALTELPQSFDLLRKHYPQRREFSHFSVRSADGALLKKATKLGFTNV
ncbi:4-phosphoerythronate dehydrogenase [Agaribacterium haliotis]|uniref:4-phosphoerythronate dehydrogenase n=1 Tax=Agaribacterium haliotis TaxID=2013869 RepID=UPI001EFCF14E|nr:4-phosphoerythronate dehydrogenase [Agaribacterium haliotis]